MGASVRVAKIPEFSREGAGGSHRTSGSVQNLGFAATLGPDFRLVKERIDIFSVLEVVNLANRVVCEPIEVPS